MFRTSEHAFFPDLSRAYNMVLAIEDKICIRKWSEGKKNYFELAGGSSRIEGSSYWG